MIGFHENQSYWQKELKIKENVLIIKDVTADY
jgi:hypothetical protein